MYVYTDIYVHIHKHIYIHTHTHTHMHTHTYMSRDIYIYNIYIDIYICTYIYPYICLYILHIYISIHIYTSQRDYRLHITSVTGHTFKKKLWPGHGTPPEHTFWASSVIFLFFVFKNMRGNSTLTMSGPLKQPRYKQNPNKVLKHFSVLEFWIQYLHLKDPNKHNPKP